MATHDYVLANASGAAFRTDLNNALAAIVSNNSNSSAPSTTYAYQWWADTSAGVLKIRNSANNGWVVLRQLDGTMLMEAGSAADPALSFDGDLDTGIFSGGANEFNIATGGTERFVINSSGDVGIGTLLPLYPLHVKGTVGTSAPADFGVLMGLSTNNDYAQIQLNGDLGAFIDFSDSGVDQKGRIVYTHSDNSMAFYTNGGEKARITSDAAATLLVGTTTNYGIGWTIRGGISQSACNFNSTDVRAFMDYTSFHSTGSAQSKITFQSDGIIFARTTTIQAYSSERRTKKNIIELDLEKAWNTLRDTPIYTFNYKDEIEGTAFHHGPIVDECPEDLIVPTQKEDEVGIINTVNTEKLQYRSYSALQQALKRIEELETKVAALQTA